MLNYEAGPTTTLHGESRMAAHVIVEMTAPDQPYNRLPYNRLFSTFVDLGFSASGESSGSAHVTMDFVPSVHLDAEGGLSTTLTGDWLMLLPQLDGVGTLITELIREKMLAATLHGVGMMTAHASRYHVDELVIVGQFRPGDQLILDSKHLTARLNGQNALHMMHGDFIELNVGTNVITYSDDQISRNIRIRVTHRDKYV